MGRVYNLRDVYNYIWGNPVAGYDVDELENDPDFMIQVLERSKDKRVYELCSDSVKSNYGFVKKVIELFSSDLDFLSDVAEFYLNSFSEAEKEQGISYAELNIIMSNLLGRTVNNFSLRAATFYASERIRTAACVNASNDDCLGIHSNKGFVFTAVQYEESDVIVDFVARRMLNDALYRGNNNLECLIHKRFRSIDELVKYGEINFLYDCISSFDQFLGIYAVDSNKVGIFADVINEALKHIDIVKYRWPMYMNKLNNWRIDYFEYELSNYILNDRWCGRLSYKDIINYVANRFGMVDLFKKYDSEFVDSYDPSRYVVLEVSDINCINKATKLMQKLLSSDVMMDSCDDYNGKSANIRYKENVDSTVIKFQLSDSSNLRAKK